MPKNITIYKGCVRVLYADNFTVVKDKLIPEVKKELIKDDDEFYISMNKFINIRYNTILPDLEEAYDYMIYTIQSRKDEIIAFLSNPEISDEDKSEFLRSLSRISSCTYFTPEELKPAYALPRKEFRQYIKSKKSK